MPTKPQQERAAGSDYHKHTRKVCFLGPSQVGKTTFLKGLTNAVSPKDGRLVQKFGGNVLYLNPSVEATATSGVHHLTGSLEFADGKELPIHFIDLPGEDYTKVYLSKDADSGAADAFRPFINECDYLYFFFSAEELVHEDAVRACISVVDDYIAANGYKPHVCLVLTKCDLIPALGAEATIEQVKAYFKSEIPDALRQQLDLLPKRTKSIHYAPLAVKPESASVPALNPSQFNALFAPLRVEVVTWPFLKKLGCYLAVLLLLSTAAGVGWWAYDRYHNNRDNQIRERIKEPLPPPATDPDALVARQGTNTQTTDGISNITPDDKQDLQTRNRLETLRALGSSYDRLRNLYNNIVHHQNTKDIYEYERQRTDWNRFAASNSDCAHHRDYIPIISAEIEDRPLLEAICAQGDYDYRRALPGEYLRRKIDVIDAYLQQCRACSEEDREVLRRALEQARFICTQKEYSLTIRLVGGDNWEWKWATHIQTDGSTEEPEMDNLVWTAQGKTFTQTTTFTWAAGAPICVSVYRDGVTIPEQRIGSFRYGGGIQSIAPFCNGKTVKLQLNELYDPDGPGEEEDFASLQFTFTLGCGGREITQKDIELVRRYIISNEWWRPRLEEARSEAQKPFPGLPQEISEAMTSPSPSTKP